MYSFSAYEEYMSIERNKNKRPFNRYNNRMEILGNLFEKLEIRYGRSLKEINSENGKYLDVKFLEKYISNEYFSKVKQFGGKILDYYHVFKIQGNHIFIDVNLKMTVVMNNDEMLINQGKTIEYTNGKYYTLQFVEDIVNLYRSKGTDLDGYKLFLNNTESTSSSPLENNRRKSVSSLLFDAIGYYISEINFIKKYIKSLYEVYYFNKIMTGIGIQNFNSSDYLELKCLNWKSG